MPDQKLRPLTDDGTITRTVEALAARNFDAVVAQTSAEALEILIDLVPAEAEVYVGTSETLDSIGYTEYFQKNHNDKNLHGKVEAESDPAKRRELHRMSSVAEYIVGSVQAIAETGEILVASASGSQIGAYAFGAKNVILVAGTQKLCHNLSDAMARVRGYTLEKHDEWLAEKGIGPAPIGKLMVMEKEVVPGRVRVILVKENLGW